MCALAAILNHSLGGSAPERGKKSNHEMCLNLGYKIIRLGEAAYPCCTPHQPLWNLNHFDLGIYLALGVYQGGTDSTHDITFNCISGTDHCEDNGGKGPCSHNCTNTLLSFTCSCPKGHQLGEDQMTCEGKIGRNYSNS